MDTIEQVARLPSHQRYCILFTVLSLYLSLSFCQSHYHMFITLFVHLLPLNGGAGSRVWVWWQLLCHHKCFAGWVGEHTSCWDLWMQTQVLPAPHHFASCLQTALKCFPTRDTHTWWPWRTFLPTEVATRFWTNQQLQKKTKKQLKSVNFFLQLCLSVRNQLVQMDYICFVTVNHLCLC